MLQRRLIRSVDEIAAIAPAWRELARLGGPAPNDPAWYAHAARFIHGASPLHVVTGWDGETLAAVAPLVLSDAGGAPRYEIIGSRVLYEPAEMLARDAGAAAWLAGEIAGLPRPVQLGRLPARGAFHDAFAARARRRGVLLTAHSSGAPYIPLTGGFEAYQAALRTHTRSELRRRQRKLKALGDVRVELVMPGEAEAARLLQEAFEVEHRSWKGRAGTAILQRADLRDVFLHYGLESARRGELHLAMLRLDGKAIAMHIATVDGRTYRQFKIGYDEAYAAYSPGLQIFLETIRWSFDRGLETHELLGTEEAWSHEWAGSVHPCTTTLFYPFSGRGVVGFLRDGVARVRGRIAAKAPRPAARS
jgi:CelD/BcsL family acetyltransferase involved in cellulose biosynthesis